MSVHTKDDADFIIATHNLKDPLASKKYTHKVPFVKVYENGINFDNNYETVGFKSPFYFKSWEGLGMKMHHTKNTLDNLVNLCGKNRMVPVIESISQKALNMRLENFVKEFKKEENSYNLLSLEVSDTYLDKTVLGPKKVYAIDWVKNTYPDNFKEKGSHTWTRHPKIAKYCLLSSKGSFTDFHIDFGGTSVWYHVLKGKKIFWLVEPTDENLELYKNWKLKSSDNRFFGAIVKKCQRIVLEEQSLFLMPSGWIHGVYTPEKSIVFGGNFLHFDAIEMQLKITKLQNETMNIPLENRFPNLEQLHWYVADYVVRCCGVNSCIDKDVLNNSTNIKKINKISFSRSQIDGLAYLVDHLKSKKTVKVEGINNLNLLFDAFKKAVEDLTNSVNNENDSEDDMPLIAIKHYNKSIRKDKVQCELFFNIYY